MLGTGCIRPEWPLSSFANTSICTVRFGPLDGTCVLFDYADLEHDLLPKLRNSQPAHNAGLAFRKSTAPWRIYNIGTARPDVPCARSGDKQVDRAFAFKEAPNPKVREWLPKEHVGFILAAMLIGLIRARIGGVFMRIAMIGAGYVGLVSGACMAEFGHDVVCVDKDAQRIAALKRGEIPIYEPGLDDLVRSNVKQARLAFTTAIEEPVRAADAVFIAVGTPS